MKIAKTLLVAIVATLSFVNADAQVRRHHHRVVVVHHHHKHVVHHR